MWLLFLFFLSVINMMRSPDNKNHEWNLQPFSLANCREKKIFPNPSTTIKRVIYLLWLKLASSSSSTNVCDLYDAWLVDRSERSKIQNNLYLKIWIKWTTTTTINKKCFWTMRKIQNSKFKKKTRSPTQIIRNKLPGLYIYP